jgi:hypothetical protein
MGRYSPTVVEETGPTLGDALIGALDAGVGMYQRRKDNQRAEAKDAREQERMKAELALLAQQTERARYENTIAPVKDQADLRKSGIVQLPPGVAPSGVSGSVPLPGGGSMPVPIFNRTANADPSRYTDIGGGYAVDRTITPETLQQKSRDDQASLQRGLQDLIEGRQTARENISQAGQDRRNVDDNATAIRVAEIQAAAARDRNNFYFSGDPRLRMNPEALRKHYEGISRDALEAAEQSMPPGDTVVYGGRSMSRAEARERIATHAILGDQRTRDYFSATPNGVPGMGVADLRAGNQAFGERPAARAGQKDAAKEAFRQRIMGTAPTANAPANAPAASARAGNPVVDPRMQVSPGVRAKALADPAFRKWLKEKKGIDIK